MQIRTATAVFALGVLTTATAIAQDSRQANWQTFQSDRFGNSSQLDVANIKPYGGRLAYQVRQVLGRSTFLFIIVGDCSRKMRKEVFNSALSRKRYAVDPEQVAALELNTVVEGSNADMELSAACNWASNGTFDIAPATASSPPESAPLRKFSELELRALYSEYRTTLNGFDYELQPTIYSSIEQAQKNRNSRLDSPPDVAPKQILKGNLVDISPDLRLAVLNLTAPGQRTPPINTAALTGKPAWVTLDLVRQIPAVGLGMSDFSLAAPQLVAKKLLPEPAVLTSDVLHHARVAWARATNVEEVKAIDISLSPNIRFGNYSTPLLNAILHDNMPVVEALLERGANPNLCGHLGCPLGMAMRSKKHADEMLNALMAAGANPDQFDANFIFASGPPLADAVALNRIDFVKMLVAKGAKPEGIPQAVKPIEISALRGNREMTQYLFNLGVSPLLKEGQDISYGTIYTLAERSKDADFVEWIEERMMQFASKDARYRWRGHIEQDGKVFPLKGTIQLRAAPFRVVLQLHASAGRVAVGTSFDKKWLSEIQQTDLGNGMFNPAMSNAITSADEPDSQYLFAYESKSGNAGDNDSWGGSMSFGSGNEQKKDFHLIRGSGDAAEFVREVRSIHTLSSQRGGTPSKKDVAQLKGLSLYLALGRPLTLSIVKQRLLKPEFVTIRFR